MGYHPRAVRMYGVLFEDKKTIIDTLFSFGHCKKQHLFCKKCGKGGDNKFCPMCGVKLIKKLIPDYDYHLPSSGNDADDNPMREVFSKQFNLTWQFPMDDRHNCVVGVYLSPGHANDYSYIYTIDEDEDFLKRVTFEEKELVSTMIKKLGLKQEPKIYEIFVSC